MEETLLTIQVPAGQTPERIDVHLTRFIQNATRTKVKAGIKEGRVSVNGQVVRKASHLVQPGDVIECRIMRPPPIEALPEDIPVDVVYEDEVLLVVDKPAGMVVHPAYGNRTGTLVNALLHHVGAGPVRFDEEEDEDADVEIDGLSTRTAGPRYAGDPTIRPGLVHRLDKGTSGLLVVAKTDQAHVHLAKQFMNRTISRRYRALVWGHPDPDAGTIETQLARSPRDRKKMAVVKPDQGKHAITHFETIERFRHFTLLQFRLETGRTHQIRVHAKHLGHPIFGDHTYDGRRIHSGLDAGSRRAFVYNLLKRLDRQALHAHTLGFRHPTTGETLHFTSELPEDFAYVVDRIRAVEGA